jgi:hypothetical protein
MIPPTLEQIVELKKIVGLNAWGCGKDGKLHVWLTKQSNNHTIEEITVVLEVAIDSSEVVVHFGEWVRVD